MVAFAGAWGIGLPALFAGVSLSGPLAAIWLVILSLIPGAAALVAARLGRSSRALPELLRRIRTWRVGMRLYAVAIGMPLGAVAVAAGASIVLGIELEPQPAILVTIPLILAANFAEETGWRGLALPALLGRMSAFRASLLLGLIWSAWHIPVQLLVPGEGKALVLLALLLQLTGVSILLTWLSIHGRGSVIVVTVAHASFNVAGNALALVTVESQLLLGIACAALGAITLAIGGQALRRPQLVD